MFYFMMGLDSTKLFLGSYNCITDKMVKTMQSFLCYLLDLLSIKQVKVYYLICWSSCQVIMEYYLQIVNNMLFVLLLFQ